MAHPVAVVAAAATPFALVAYLADAVGWESWGRLMLNVCLVIASMILCFPPGSSPRWAAARPSRRSAGTSTGYIELFRGAPLFVRLLMADVALGRLSGAPLHRPQEERTKELLLGALTRRSPGTVRSIGSRISATRGRRGTVGPASCRRPALEAG